MVVIDEHTGESYGQHLVADAEWLCRRLNEQHRPKTEECSVCRDQVEEPGRSNPPLCHACVRMAADSALSDLLGHAKALRDGRPPFNVLSSEERREQFEALVGDIDDLPDELVVDLAGRCAESITRRLHGVPEPAVARSAPGTPLYDSGGYRPTSAERDEIESRIEIHEVDVPPVDDVPVYNIARFRIDDGFEPRPAA
jgi:hypothetical protein